MLQQAAARPLAGRLRALLDADEVDVDGLRACCACGIPDGGSLRPLCWRLLLNYLPRRKEHRHAFLDKQRSLYHELVQDLVAKPDSANANGAEQQQQAACGADHPLSERADSAWSTYFKDNEVLLQIDKDVRRLYPEIAFFQQTTAHPNAAMHSAEARARGVQRLCKRVTHTFIEARDVRAMRGGGGGCSFVDKKAAGKRCKLRGGDYYEGAASDGDECHWEVVERILFLYYKLNPGVKYVQGMNEIVGPLYYVLCTGDEAAHAEPDAFFCFQNLLGEIGDRFSKALDDSSLGIESTMNRLYSLLKVHDGELHKHLTAHLDLVPQYYAFRWISLMLSQEFLLPDVIQVWDSLFADARRFDLLIYICLAMLVNARGDLLSADFTGAMKLLQNYPSVDVGQLVTAAIELQRSDLKRSGSF